MFPSGQEAVCQINTPGNGEAFRGLRKGLNKVFLRGNTADQKSLVYCLDMIPWRRAIPLACLIAAVCAGSAEASELSYVITSTGQFGTVNLSTGSETLIANEGGVSEGIATGANGDLYIVDGLNNLDILNPASGAKTVVGNTGISLTTFGATTTGALFGFDAAENLYSINPATGVAALIGSTGLPAVNTAPANFGNSLSGNATELFYTLQIYSGTAKQASELYAIDPLTAKSTLIGPTGISAILGSEFADNMLYGFSYTSSDKIVTLNTTTGAASKGAALSGPFTLIYGATAATPEPSFAPLAGVVFGIALLVRKHKRYLIT